MAPRDTLDSLFREFAVTDRRFRNFAWFVLGYSLLVILWGYFLRISESGDGCGTDWPLCHGAVVPSAAAFPTWVEFIHRVSSGLVLVLVVVMAGWAFRRLAPGHAVRKAAGASLLLTVSESLFGALLVVFGLVATDISTARILVRPFHVTNTFLLMAALALTAWWAHRGVTRTPTLRQPGTRPLVLAGFGLLALAWTGSWTGLAGTAFPAGSVAEGFGQYLDPQHLLIYLRLSHPVVAVLATVLFARLALGRLVAGRQEAGRQEAEVPHSAMSDSVPPGFAPPGSSVRRIERALAVAVAILAGVQLVLGPATILLLHPTGLRLVHLLIADLLWIALLFLGSEMLSPPDVRSERSPLRPPDSSQRQPGVARP